MLGGRVFYSDDNWLTIWEFRGSDKKPRRVRNQEEADQIRFLVVAQG